MMKSGLLRKVFLGAVVGISSAFIASDNFPPGNLTDGEKDQIRSVFGDSVKVDVIRKRLNACADSSSQMWTEWGTTREITACYQSTYSEDYSKEKYIANYGGFMHEVTHIWQNKNLWPWQEKGCSDYQYTLDASLAFSDYCAEQQAAVVADYVRRFLYPGGGYSRYLADTPETDQLLQKVVEDKFPAARATRLAAQEENKKENIKDQIKMGVHVASGS